MSAPTYDKVTLDGGPLASTTLRAPSSATYRLELRDRDGRRVVYYGDTTSGALQHDMLADALAGRPVKPKGRPSAVKFSRNLGFSLVDTRFQAWY